MFQFGSKLANWLVVGLVTSLSGQPSASVGDAAKRVRRTAWAFQFDQTDGVSSYSYHHTWSFQSAFQGEVGDWFEVVMLVCRNCGEHEGTIGAMRSNAISTDLKHLRSVLIVFEELRGAR